MCNNLQYILTSFSANSNGSNLTKSVFKLSACCLAKLDIVRIAVESSAPSLGVRTKNKENTCHATQLPRNKSREKLLALEKINT